MVIFYTLSEKNTIFFFIADDKTAPRIIAKSRFCYLVLYITTIALGDSLTVNFIPCVISCAPVNS